VRSASAAQFDSKCGTAFAVKRDSRAAMMAALKNLNLDLEPLGKAGRQPGR